jgi:hypothetical protein
LFVKNQEALFSRIFFRVIKNGRFLESAGGGVGGRVRKRAFLARAIISGKKWFDFSNMEFCFFPKIREKIKCAKKSLSSMHLFFSRIFAKE